MVSSYARTKEASQAKYISILNIIQGEVDPTQVSIDCSQPQLSEALFYAHLIFRKKKSGGVLDRLRPCGFLFNVLSVHWSLVICP